MNKQLFYSIPLEQLFVQLQSSEKGLQSAVAEERVKLQEKFFKTESRFKKELSLLVRQFTNPLVLLLVVALVLSGLAGHSSDSAIVFIILITTGLMGFWQELNAGKAMEKLHKMTETRHATLRDGVLVELPAREIVPGDVLFFNAGDIIPADGRIIECNDLHLNESALTGESFPVEKSTGTLEKPSRLNECYNCLWQGSDVISGTASCLVVHTGNETAFGQMAHSLVQTPETAFEKGIRHFGGFLLKITVLLSLITLVANLYFHQPFFDALLFSLALAVGMAPELLPAIMTFAMAAGIKRMYEKKVIVKKLSAIFNFGEVNVLCTDKTGTITEGVATLKHVVDVHGNPDERLKLYAFLNAVFQSGFTNPVDKALASLNLPVGGYRKINEIPYDFIRKRLSVAVEREEERFFITKGAFANVIQVCAFTETAKGITAPLGETERKQLEDQFIAYCEKGFRVLGLSYRQTVKDKITRADETDMIFLGFILLEDPLKPEARSSIQRLNALRIEVKIITGDNRFAALHTAQQLGIINPVILTGEEMDTLSPEALVVKAKSTNIFTGIEPHQKELIVKALQKSHLTVAYTGDGVNDVAAINAADIGISTSNAMDITREAADFVLMEKDLSVLADGVLEGRRSFANSMKYIFINTGATFGNMVSIAGASLFLPFLPMLPKQILLTNLLTDIPFLTIASDQVDKEELTRPKQWDLKLIRRFMIVFGLHSSAFDFLTFYVLFVHFRLSGAAFRAGWFWESAITELLILFVMRTKKPVTQSKPGQLLLLTAIMALIIIVYLPLSPFAAMLGFSIAHTRQIGALAVILVMYLVTADLLKKIFFKLNTADNRMVTNSFI